MRTRPNRTSLAKIKMLDFIPSEMGMHWKMVEQRNVRCKRVILAAL